MSGLDWQKAEAREKVGKRGGDPVGADLPPPAGTGMRAGDGEVRDAVAEMLPRFEAKAYAEQLAYLTEVRRRLWRLLRSDEAVEEWVAREFAPRLKKAGRKRERPPRDREIAADFVALVARRPRRLFPKECVALLAGEDVQPGLRTDPGYGTWSHIARAELQAVLKRLVNSGELNAAPGGRLELRGG